jgi:hypothetical protein
MGFRAVLATRPVLDTLEPSALDALVGACQERYYGRREPLWRREERAEIG